MAVCFDESIKGVLIYFRRRHVLAMVADYLNGIFLGFNETFLIIFYNNGGNWRDFVARLAGKPVLLLTTRVRESDRHVTNSKEGARTQ